MEIETQLGVVRKHGTSELDNIPDTFFMFPYCNKLNHCSRMMLSDHRYV